MEKPSTSSSKLSKMFYNLAVGNCVRWIQPQVQGRVDNFINYVFFASLLLKCSINGIDLTAQRFFNRPAWFENALQENWLCCGLYAWAARRSNCKHNLIEKLHPGKICFKDAEFSWVSSRCLVYTFFYSPPLKFVTFTLQNCQLLNLYELCTWPALWKRIIAGVNLGFAFLCRFR